jgi:hypothetical protein
VKRVSHMTRGLRHVRYTCHGETVDWYGWRYTADERARHARAARALFDAPAGPEESALDN